MNKNLHILNINEKIYLLKYLISIGIVERVLSITKVFQENDFYILIISGSILDIPYCEIEQNLFKIPEGMFENMQLNREYNVNEILDLY